MTQYFILFSGICEIKTLLEIFLITNTTFIVKCLLFYSTIFTF